MFISQSRLMETDAGTPGNSQPITPVDRVRFPGIVSSVASAMSGIPPGQRPDPERWGAFELRYDLKCSVEVEILGVRRGLQRHVLVFYDVWTSPESRQAGDPPVLRESLERGFGRRYGRQQILADLRQTIRRRLIDVSLRGITGDLRDPRLVEIADEDDPEGMLADARTLERVIDVDTAVTNPSNAPERQNPEG